MWECVDIAPPAPGMWAELAETGWDAVIAWSAGAENLGRLLSSDVGRTVSVVCTRGGVVERFEEAFTEKDRQVVDEDVGEYLAAAGSRRGREVTAGFSACPPLTTRRTLFLKTSTGPSSALRALDQHILLNCAPSLKP